MSLTADTPEPSPKFSFAHDEAAWSLLRELKLSLVCTTYQAGKVIVLRAGADRISALLRSFDWATGLAFQSSRAALGTKTQIWFLQNERDIAAQLPGAAHDACFVPRHCHVTGDIRVHEMAWGQAPESELWFVNTRFSCLCTLDPKYTFVPRWRPPFVSACVPEDRCHLNGLAMRDGQPRYVTALGVTDKAEGWRPGKADGGVLIDVQSGEVHCRGLSMPHSPRWHGGRLYLLNSGFGDVVAVDLSTGKSDTVVRLPGYTRGWCVHDDYAFVGLSKVREQREFGGIPLQKQQAELRCGIWILRLSSGQVSGFIEFTGGVEEIFAVESLPKTQYPHLIGFEKETINGIYVLPSSMATSRGAVDAVMTALGQGDVDPIG